MLKERASGEEKRRNIQVINHFEKFSGILSAESN